jgi:hypothetical protein
MIRFQVPVPLVVKNFLGASPEGTVAGSIRSACGRVARISYRLPSIHCQACLSMSSRISFALSSRFLSPACTVSLQALPTATCTASWSALPSLTCALARSSSCHSGPALSCPQSPTCLSFNCVSSLRRISYLVCYLFPKYCHLMSAAFVMLFMLACHIYRFSVCFRFI